MLNIKMGNLQESTLKSLTKPCETCVHDCNVYFLDSMECESSCGQNCCRVHLHTNAHNADSEDFESAEEENAQ